MPFYGGGGGMAHRLGMKPELGDRPAQRRLRGVRARPETGPQPAAIRRGPHRADRRRAERGRADLRSADGAAQGAGVGARRRCRGGTGDRVRRVPDPRRRMPHLRRVRRRHDARDRPAPQVVAGRPRGGLHRLHRKPRSPRCWPAATGRCPRWPTRCAIESACRPRTSTCSSPTSRTGCSCAIGARHSSFPRNRHLDTFDDCGNLFAAGIPVNLDRAITDGRVAPRRHRDDGRVRACR